jgi:hypothetical protein
MSCLALILNHDVRKNLILSFVAEEILKINKIIY